MEFYTDKLEKTTNIYPIIPLRGRVTFPHNLLTFEVGRESTMKAVQRASDTDKTLLILTQKQKEKEDVGADDLYTVGVVARIKQIIPLPQNSGMRVTCEGLYRAKAKVITLGNGFFSAVCEALPLIHGDEVQEEAHFRTIKALAKDAFGGDSKFGKDFFLRLDSTDKPDEYVDIVINAMRVRVDIKQELLEETRLPERLKLIERCLNDEIEISKIEKKLSSSVRQSMDKSQKEYFLREQLKAIHAELGDDGQEADEYREKIQAKNLPKELESKCLKEIDRLSRMPSSAAEYTVIASYLDQVLELPWTEETKDTERLEDCKKVLEADHYGLEKIKERIIEYLAVLKLTNSMKSPILCFVGPPGVGKTSIAQSIARSLNRKFVRMSLGGVKDEAEIRGHRRTYIGAMPGRILYGMKEAGTINPVFLLDEIDKITSDMHGDPASALLEVLDPEQNATFRDRYLEAPYDLSKVMFVTTANSLDGIPAPLRDRMEIIQLSGYTMEEKLEIAKRYLVPKQSKMNGLSEENIKFTEEGLRLAIEGYTREAGVRSLERTVGSLCRKVAVAYASDKNLPLVKIGKKKVTDLLGTPRYKAEEDTTAMEIGAVNGLAWTAVGGTILTVEATKMTGKGEVKLTGKLGDVMKESALAALSFIRSHADVYGIDAEIFAKTDLHIHVPEGATPKDGPSAGITIATAILSVLTEKRVRAGFAMTGEITLRGKVLPIGGLKEKALAARRQGIQKVIIPEGNVRDLDELPKVLKKDVTFLPVSSVDEVFRHVLLGASVFKTKKKKSNA